MRSTNRRVTSVSKAVQDSAQVESAFLERGGRMSPAGGSATESIWSVRQKE